MTHFIRAASALVLGLQLFLSPAVSGEFAGWQDWRVVEQQGRPHIIRAADLDGDGRAELIVVNSRRARLDLYHWRDVSAAAETGSLTAGGEVPQPNELPLAREIEHQELRLEHVPRDVLARDLNHDGLPELIVLMSPPNQVVVYRWQQGAWQRHFKLDLLRGKIPASRDTLLLRSLPAGGWQLLVSLEDGIQQLPLTPGGRAGWLTPREQQGRVAWWLADLDGDGRRDLIEQTREADASVRWYRCAETGVLTPAAVLLDRAVKDVELFQSGAAAQLAILDGRVRGILRSYALGAGADSPFGMRRPLALEDGLQAVWCGMRQGKHRALVVADRRAPRLLSYRLGAAGWETQQDYPALTDIRSLATLSAQPETLLLWTKNGADLSRSRWKNGRLTYPRPWPQSASQSERKILALDSVGPWTWWVQKVGQHLDLYVAGPEIPDPRPIRFPEVGGKADQVLWIGGQRLLVKESRGRALKLFQLVGDRAEVRSPTHLKKASLADFKLVAVGKGVELRRLADGVLQWLGDDLQSREQVMLPHGQALTAYVAEDAASGWALERDSPYLHRIEIDASRLSRSVERVKVVQGVGLRHDPVLEMLLVGHDRVTQLEPGRAPELQLQGVVDQRVGRARGVRKTGLHRLSTTDIDGDGCDELIVYDHLRHRLTVLAACDGTLQPLLIWPVFDDKVYPYRDDSDNLVAEPRSVVAADFDGDGKQDLALLCHDRLLVYLGSKKL